MKLPTKKQYDKAEPFAKGWMAYTFSAWPGSKIPAENKCPYEQDTGEWQEFQSGVQAAILNAQDSEE